MAGILSTLVVTGLLTAAPGSFNFDGPEVSARTTSSTGFFIQGAAPLANQTERGFGSVELVVEERIAVPRATYGDSGSLNARFRIGGVEYAVELTAVGFPPPQVLTGVSGPLPRGLQQPVGGGVMLNVDLHGATGLGFSTGTQVHAGAAVWGIGRVLRNGQLLTDTAIIHAAALTAGARTDDDVHGVLPLARPGDHELHVLVWNLPAATEPRGFIEFSFDDVSIDWNGVRLPAVASLPNTLGSNGGPVASGSPVPLNALGAPATTPNAVGGSGAAGVGAGATDPIDPFLGEGRVAVAVGQPSVAQPDVDAPGQPGATGNAVDPFLGPGRVAISTPQIGNEVETEPPGSGFIRTPTGVQTPTDPFLSPGRVAITPDNVGGLSPVTQTPLAGAGSFSFVAQGTTIPGPAFNFGATASDLDVNRTPSLPGTVPGQTSAVPLVATPQPLNAQSPVPLVALPTPLNAQTPVPLVSTPAPLNTQPLSPPAGVPGTAPVTTPAPAPPATPAPAPAP
jgi:hypothetical protein